MEDRKKKLEAMKEKVAFLQLENPVKEEFAFDSKSDAEPEPEVLRQGTQYHNPPRNNENTVKPDLQTKTKNKYPLHRQKRQQNRK